MGWQENKLRYNARYKKENYQQINLSVPKGMRDKIKAAAESDGKTMTAYILAAVEEKISRQKKSRLRAPAKEQRNLSPPQKG